MQRKTESDNLINELLAINTQQKAPLTAAKYKISQYIHFKINQSPCTFEKSSSQGEYKRIYSQETQCNLIELFAQNHRDILREEKDGRLSNLPKIADIFYSSYQEMFAKNEINEFLRKPTEDKKRETKDNANVLDRSDELSDIHIDDLDYHPDVISIYIICLLMFRIIFAKIPLIGQRCWLHYILIYA